MSRGLRLALVLALLASSTGCDTVRARFRAREGVALYEKGDFLWAAIKFDEAVVLDDQVPVLLMNLGTSNLAHFRSLNAKSVEGQNAGRRAITAYEKYLTLKPGDERVKVALVQIFIETGRYDDAVAFFKPQTDKSPPDLEALSTMATIATKCNKPDEAQGWYKRRIQSSPDKPEGYLALGVFVWGELHDHPDQPLEKKREKAQVALEALKKAIELQPANPNAYTYVNLVYRDMSTAEPGPDDKRKALEEANKYYQMALERQNGQK